MALLSLKERLHQVVEHLSDDDIYATAKFVILALEDIGDAVGLTNVHVNRVIKELMSEGLIYCNKKHLKILDEEKLSQIAEFDPDMVIAHPFA